MKILDPLIYNGELILVYKGSNQAIHRTPDRMSHQRLKLIPNLTINGGQDLEWCVPFKILDMKFMFVLFGRKVYQILENEGEKVYIELKHAYFYYFRDFEVKGRQIILHGLLTFDREYSEKCILNERFRYQLTLRNDKHGNNLKMLEEAERLFQQAMEEEM
ncbi:MAG: hypothetical protein WCY89_07050 [Flavobacteriaceae bacterium]